MARQLLIVLEAEPLHVFKTTAMLLVLNALRMMLVMILLNDPSLRMDVALSRAAQTCRVQILSLLGLVFVGPKSSLVKI